MVKTFSSAYVCLGYNAHHKDSAGIILYICFHQIPCFLNAKQIRNGREHSCGHKFFFCSHSCE